MTDRFITQTKKMDYFSVFTSSPPAFTKINNGLKHYACLFMPLVSSLKVKLKIILNRGARYNAPSAWSGTALHLPG